MPEGDTLHRAARRLQVLVGERLEVESPHPRAKAERVAEQLDGRRLDSVEAVGKNLVLRFEGGVVLRSHLRMRGRWAVRPRGSPSRGLPWLVLRGSLVEGVLWNGPVLELGGRSVPRLGPDILGTAAGATGPDVEAIVVNLRAQPRRDLGDALLDQRVVAGIGNMWKAEGLWRARLSPWLKVASASDDELRALLLDTALLMRQSVAGARPERRVYRRAGRPCPRCGARISSRGQGDDNRTAYWCPRCQRGEDGAAA